MRKRRLAFLLAALLCFSLCACSSAAVPQGGEGVFSPVSSTGSTFTAPSTGETTTTAAPTPPPPVQVAGKLDPATLTPKRSVKAFQDIVSFFGRRCYNWQETYREEKVTEEDGAAIVEYVELLVKEFDYEIVAATHFDPTAADPFVGNLTTGSWEVLLALRTVDTGRETTGRLNTSVSCDLRLHGTKGKMTLVFADLFHTEDYGYRWSGHTGDRLSEVFGQRAGDAYCLENGRYVNGSDRVLSVEAGTNRNGRGQAVLLINGERALYTAEARIRKETYVDYPCDDYQIVLEDFLPDVADEEIHVTVPTTLSGGEVFTLGDGFGRLGNSPTWVIYDPGEGTIVRSSDADTPRAAMKACTVRILQWGKEECLVYIAMDMISELEPMTVEILAALPAWGSASADNFREEEAIPLKVGETMELTYQPPYVFMPNYETYEWKLISGQGVAIVGSGDKCTVTAVAAGNVIVRCVYSYGKDEGDVLTGIPRNENHTKTKTYYLTISP